MPAKKPEKIMMPGYLISIVSTGSEIPAAIEARLTIFEMMSISIHINKVIRTAFGLRIKKTPRLVATPFPPLNFR